MISRWLGPISLVFAAAVAGAWACSSSGNNPGTGGGGGAGGGSGGSGGSGGATTQPSSSGVVTTTTPTGNNVGLACTKASDCGPGLSCSTSDSDDSTFGGGPPGGYCTTTCASAFDCPSGSECILSGSNVLGECVLICSIGPKLVKFDDALSPNKCWGRNDVRCTTNGGSKAICVPTCSSDAQCPTGRACDPRTSVCVTTPTKGLPTGAYCSPNVMPTLCAGRCLTFTNTSYATCTEDCVLGGDPMHPTDDPGCGGVTQGLCIYRPANNGAGDYGYCAPACSKQDDCQNPDFWCSPEPGLTGMGVTNGYCTTAVSCPNGNSDCTNVAMANCTQTMYGPFCLTNDFPLGSAAPDAGTDAAADDGGDDGGTTDGGTDAAPDDGGDDGGTTDGGTDAAPDDGGDDGGDGG